MTKVIEEDLYVIRNYPDLSLVEYKIRQFLNKDADYQKKLREATEQYKKDRSSTFATNRYHWSLRPDIVMDVFLQLWGSTALGFNGIGGQAMTEAYTVVAHDRTVDVYIVCFDEKMAYMVTNPTKEFYEDLEKRSMASVASAGKRY